MVNVNHLFYLKNENWINIHFIINFIDKKVMLQLNFILWKELNNFSLFDFQGVIFIEINLKKKIKKRLITEK